MAFSSTSPGSKIFVQVGEDKIEISHLSGPLQQKIQKIDFEIMNPNFPSLKEALEKKPVQEKKIDGLCSEIIRQQKIQKIDLNPRTEGAAATATRNSLVMQLNNLLNDKEEGKNIQQQKLNRLYSAVLLFDCLIDNAPEMNFNRRVEDALIYEDEDEDDSDDEDELPKKKVKQTRKQRKTFSMDDKEDPPEKLTDQILASHSADEDFDPGYLGDDETSPSNLSLDDVYRDLYNSIADEGAVLSEQLQGESKDFDLLADTLINARLVKDNPENNEARENLIGNAKALEDPKYKKIGRKILGGILILFGAALITAGVLGALHTGGLSALISWKPGVWLIGVGGGLLFGAPTIYKGKSVFFKPGKYDHIIGQANELLTSSKPASPKKIK